MTETSSRQLKMLVSNVTVKRLSSESGDEINGFAISGRGASALKEYLETAGVSTGTMTKGRFTLSREQISGSSSAYMTGRELASLLDTVVKDKGVAIF